MCGIYVILRFRFIIEGVPQVVSPIIQRAGYIVYKISG